MRKTTWVLLALIGLFARGALGAAPEPPVAEGFPKWTGVEEANYLMGRPICPSDLRQRAVMVVLFDAAQLSKHFPQIARLCQQCVSSGYGEERSSWMVRTLPMNGFVVLVNTGKRVDIKTFRSAFNALKDEKSKKYSGSFRAARAPVYNAVTYGGAPDPGAAPVYAYVLEPNATEPVWKGAIDDKSLKTACLAFKKAKKKSPAWKPYFGSLDRVDHPFPDVVKAYESGKSVEQFYAKLIAAIKGHDAEKAKAAQLVYDALEQTRSGLEARILFEVKDSPATAYADIEELVHYWPSAKKHIAESEKTLKRHKDAATLGEVLGKVRHYMAEDFVCKSEAEAKKIQSELKRLAASIAKLKDSKDIKAQNDASLLSSMIETLVGEIPQKVKPQNH